MKYVLKLTPKKITREELNERIDDMITNYLCLTTCINLLCILFFVIQTFCGKIPVMVAVQRSIRITILFGNAVFIANGIHRLLLLEWSAYKTRLEIIYVDIGIKIILPIVMYIILLVIMFNVPFIQ